MGIRALWGAQIARISRLFLSAWFGLAFLLPSTTLANSCDPGEFGRFADFVQKIQCKGCDEIMKDFLTDLIASGRRKDELSVWNFKPSSKFSEAQIRELFDFAEFPNFPQVVIDRKTGEVLIPGSEKVYAIDFFVEQLMNKMKLMGSGEPTKSDLALQIISADFFLGTMKGGGAIGRRVASGDGALNAIFESDLAANISDQWITILNGVRRWRAAHRNRIQSPRSIARDLIAARRTEVESNLGVTIRFIGEDADVAVKAKEPEIPAAATPPDAGFVDEEDVFTGLYGNKNALAEMQEAMGGMSADGADDAASATRSALDEMQAAMDGVAEIKALPTPFFEKGVSLRSLMGRISPDEAKRIDRELAKIIEISQFSIRELKSKLGTRTLKEYVEVADGIHYETRRRLTALHDSIPENPDTEMIRALVQRAIRSTNQHRYGRISERGFNEIAHRLVRIDRRQSPEMQRVLSLALAGSSASVAEIRFAMRMPGLQYAGVRLKELPYFADITTTMDDAGERMAVYANVFGDRRLADIEIDAVFNYGKAWGEFKNSSAMVSAYDGGFERLLDQAKRQVRARKIMIEKGLLPKDHEIHWTFANGVDDEAAEQLRRVGIHVVGPVSE